MIGPDVIETRGGEERRRMSEEFIAAAYWEKHLHAHKEKHRYQAVIRYLKHIVYDLKHEHASCAI